MKKLYLRFILMIVAAAVMGCSNDDESETTDTYDPTYKVSYYRQDPNLNQRQGYWYDNKFIELTPQKEPPYTLIVKWDNDEGEKAFNYIVDKKDGVVIQKYDNYAKNSAVILCNKYISCPYLYVSSSYKSSTGFLYENEFMQIDNRILLKMKEGKSVDAIAKKYADVLTLDTNRENARGTEAFDCALKTSCEVLQLAEEINLRDDVEWAEPNMYAPIHLY